MDIAIDVSNRSIEFFGELASNNGAYGVGNVKLVVYLQILLQTIS